MTTKIETVSKEIALIQEGQQALFYIDDIRLRNCRPQVRVISEVVTCSEQIKRVSVWLAVDDSLQWRGGADEEMVIEIYEQAT